MISFFFATIYEKISHFILNLSPGSGIFLSTALASGMLSFRPQQSIFLKLVSSAKVNIVYIDRLFDK